MKRVLLFIATNLAIIVVISIIFSVFDLAPYLSAQGLNYTSLLIFALIIGFMGSFISLFISKWMAKHAYNVQVIASPETAEQARVFNVIKDLSKKLNIKTPEVGIYESEEPNAFATGWNKNASLVAVSTGLLQAMNDQELLGVLGHEMSHISNGDMVTMALLQGVVNTFVIFFARIAAYLVMSFLSRDSDGGERSAVGGLAYYGIAIIFEIVFGILASTIVMWFSRYREFRADAGSAKLTGTQTMIASLECLQRFIEAPEDQRAPSLKTLQISSKKNWLALFSSHPPLEDRIKALQRRTYRD